MKYKKFQAPISKGSIVMIYAKVKWKASKFCNHSLVGGHICSFHSGLRTIPHLILTHNTQDFDLINAYLICVIVHVQMWCICSSTCWSNPKKIFECFICFWKWFYTFVLLVFLTAFLCFSSKIGSEVFLREACNWKLPAKGN